MRSMPGISGSPFRGLRRRPHRRCRRHRRRGGQQRIRVGTFSRPGDGRRFAGLVTDAGVVELDGAVGGLSDPVTTTSLLADWDRVLPLLDSVAADGARAGAGEPLDGLHVHAPLSAGLQVE